MNIPNILTITRIFLIPIFILFFFSNLNNSFLYSIIIFIIAGITDVIDGSIARKFNLVTKLGTILDPLADKFMIITVLTCFAVKNYIPIWILMIVAIKEFLMIIGGILLYNDNIVVPSNNLGKIATFMFYFSIATFLFNSHIAIYFLYIAVLATLFAFTRYLINYIKEKRIL